MIYKSEVDKYNKLYLKKIGILVMISNSNTIIKQKM